MARTPIEERALTDSRFAFLGRIVGDNRWGALGRCAVLWNECAERATYVLPRTLIDALFDDINNLAAALVAADLARQATEEDLRIDVPSEVFDHLFPDGVAPDVEGRLYLRGTRGRIEWLAKAKYNGATKGGRPKGTNHVGTRVGNHVGTPIAVAPALAPTEENPLSVSPETDGADVIDSDLQDGALFWNETIAPEWGKARVTFKTLQSLNSKHRSLKSFMRNHRGWSLLAALRRAYESLPGLRSESWFTFKDFFFRHGFLEKNEKLWTGFYDSIHGAKASPKSPPPRLAVVPLASEER